jgi:hypothetical protein
MVETGRRREGATDLPEILVSRRFRRSPRWRDFSNFRHLKTEKRNDLCVSFQLALLLYDATSHTQSPGY